MLLPNIKDISCIIFDFDGVFTDNKVYTDDTGKEFISCSKADSLGLDLLKRYLKKNRLLLDVFILSTETNSAVKRRADKLKLKCFQGCKNKADFISKYSVDTSIDVSDIVVVANDINDLGMVKLAGFSVCPEDAHPLILKNVDLVLPFCGGNGFVRSFVEKLLPLNKMSESELMEVLIYGEES